MKQIHIALFLSILLTSCAPSATSIPTVTSPISIATLQPEIGTSVASLPTITPVPEPQWIYLSDLNPNLTQAGYWAFAIGKYPASEGSMKQGATIHNGSQTYPHGLFAAAPSNIRYELNGQYQTFKTEIFIDQSMVCEADGALFQVHLDGELLYSQHMDTPRKAPSEVQSVSLDIRGGNTLLLHADPGERDDIACDATIWGEPMLLTNPSPQTVVPPTAPLEQQPVLTRELERFSNAMRAAGVFGADQSFSTADVRVVNFKDYNGKAFDAAVVHFDPDREQSGEAFEGDYPLLIREAGQWRQVGLRFWAEANQIQMALPLIANDSMLDDPTFPLELFRDNATQVVVAETFQADHIFADFTTDTWKRILTDWEKIESQLDSGIVPDDFTYHWEGIDRTLAVANTLGMSVRTENIFIDAFRTPQAILDGNYSPNDLERLYEFMVKVPILHYRNRIDSWLVVSEPTGWLSSGRGPEKSWGFPYLQLGGVDIIEKAYDWAHEANPDATLILTDDLILLDKMVSDYGPTQPHWNQVFFQTISELKTRNTPINAIDIENNYWIYNPPDPAFMRSQLERIRDLGYSIYAPEVTVLTSETFPWTSIQSQKEAKVTNPIAAQALIYQQTLQTYLDLDIPWFGLGGLTDRFSFWRYSGYPEAHAMIFDYNQQPKAAYYLLVSTFYTHLGNK